MKTTIQHYWLHLLVLAAPLVFIAAVWPQIPERVPVHFNIRFQADGYMSRGWGTLLLPLTNIGVLVFSMLWFRHDPKMAKCDPDTREQVRSVMRICLLATNALFSACSVALVYASWGRFEVVAHTINYGLPLLYLCLGNYMGKLRPNYTIGIRCPWTLESPEVWARTHRFSGRVLVVLSLTLIALKVAGFPEFPYAILLISTLAGWAILALAYAFFVSRRLKPAPGAGAE